MKDPDPHPHPDPGPHQNVMDPQNWLRLKVYLKRVLRTVGVSFLRVAGRDLSTRSTNLTSSPSFLISFKVPDN